MIQEQIENYLCNFFASFEGDKSIYSIAMSSNGIPEPDGTGRHKIKYTLVKEYTEERIDNAVFEKVRDLDLLKDIMKMDSDWMLNRHIITDIFITTQLNSVAEEYQVPITGLAMYFKTNETGDKFAVIGYSASQQLMRADGVTPWQMGLEELMQGM